MKYLLLKLTYCYVLNPSCIVVSVHNLNFLYITLVVASFKLFFNYWSCAVHMLWFARFVFSGLRNVFSLCHFRSIAALWCQTVIICKSCLWNIPWQIQFIKVMQLIQKMYSFLDLKDFSVYLKPYSHWIFLLPLRNQEYLKAICGLCHQYMIQHRKQYIWVDWKRKKLIVFPV